MLPAVTRNVRDGLNRRRELIPLGFTWSFIVLTNISVLLIVIVSALQRPRSDLPTALVALALALIPATRFFVFGVKYSAWLVWVCWSTAAALLLFVTATPIDADFAPVLLVLMVGDVVSVAGVPVGLLATASAAGLLLVASATHRLDAAALYLSFVAMGWLVGYLMRAQQRLLLEQREAHAALAAHAVADERRRIAREVHDVIAHSLSVTLLHVTGARRALQQDRDVDDAVEALEHAENLGRHAMTDIRRTVGLLDTAPMTIAPEPGIDDIAPLVDGFVKAGLKVTSNVGGPTGRVSAATGLALYRITQESLANIAKHAPESRSSVSLSITPSTASLEVVNDMADVPLSTVTSEGRGLRGMRQRVETLGGTIDLGPQNGFWRVRAEIPLNGRERRQRCGS
ncbi:histidine kinase [Mycobacterium sp. GA-1285]|uniref:sensor histidine kinase n=1 Tax=Mycobacterium sp. GA-1285 TaxID=1772282 RepID=UPI000747ACB1|nr:histidine kinase [Mycobacterium sp. GA-1285]KUI23433.1 histidine kinase [Mycobacterium sp. GA-1285]